jgi:hypothetical protein
MGLALHQHQTNFVIPSPMGLRPTKVDEKRSCRHPERSEGPAFFVHPWRHFGTLTTFFEGAKREICFFLGPAMLSRVHEKADP